MFLNWATDQLLYGSWPNQWDDARRQLKGHSTGDVSASEAALARSIAIEPSASAPTLALGLSTPAGSYSQTAALLRLPAIALPLHGVSSVFCLFLGAEILQVNVKLNTSLPDSS